MDKRAFNYIIFGGLLVTIAIVVNRHYAGLRGDLESNWGV